MMKKSMLIILSIIMVIIIFMAIGIQAEDTKPRNLETVLSEIVTEQGVQSKDRIDVKKVSDAKLEELGNSVMEAVIGDSTIHEQLNTRIGGNGSNALKAFHIRLGYNYLDDYPLGMLSYMSSGMMSKNGVIRRIGDTRGMMGNDFWGYDSMMGNFGWLGIIIGCVLVILLVLIIILLIKRMRRT
ncbi:MAG: hypothetical protein ACYCYI_09660 [Saccharofermentanales bacterium]